MNATIKVTTCQICARPIKANTGVIANHGYTRPGYGWQTASCFGARFKPYEVSRDAIKSCIISYTEAGKNQEARLAELLATPPATITEHRNYRSSYSEPDVYERPADFDAEATLNASTLRYGENYAHEYRKLVKMTRANIADIAEAIKFLEQRYDAWEAKA